MLPILSVHTVHHELAQAMLQVSLHQQRVVMQWAHSPVHQGVSTGKVQHLIRQLLGAAVWPLGLVGGLAGTLQGQEGRCLATSPSSEPFWVPSHIPLWDHLHLSHSGDRDLIGIDPITPHGDVGTAHHAWARVGHAALVGSPLVEGAVLVGKGPVEDLADVGHAVDTDGRALKDMAGRGQ